MRSLKSALYRTIYKYSFVIETSFSVECCLLNHSGPKRTLRRVNLIYFVDRKEHAIPLFVHAKILPITFLYYEAVCKLMFDVHNDSAPSNITKLFTRTSNIHTYNTRSSTSQFFSVKYFRLKMQKKKSLFACWCQSLE